MSSRSNSAIQDATGKQQGMGEGTGGGMVGLFSQCYITGTDAVG